MGRGEKPKDENEKTKPFFVKCFVCSGYRLSAVPPRGLGWVRSGNARHAATVRRVVPIAKYAERNQFFVNLLFAICYGWRRGWNGWWASIFSSAEI
jgi:hypothetical protein